MIGVRFGIVAVTGGNSLKMQPKISVDTNILIRYYASLKYKEKEIEPPKLIYF